MRNGLGPAVALCIAGAGAIFLPDELTAPVRGLMRDAARPGQAAVQSCLAQLRVYAARLQEPQPALARLEALQHELRAERAERRRLEWRQAELQGQMAAAHSDSSRPSAETGDPLLLPGLLEVRVLGAETAAPWKGRRVLAAGAREGVAESLLVLEGTGPLLDQGSEMQLTVDQTVLSGRTVVGRIGSVGRWTSTLRPVTDPAFAGHARILRATAAGWSPGPQGILTGDGTRCRLTLVDAREPVEVGDHVYTAEEDGVLPEPMYYGRVVEAELQPGNREWRIVVEPEARPDRLRTVQVLRTVLNPARALAN